MGEAKRRAAAQSATAETAIHDIVSFRHAVRDGQVYKYTRLEGNGLYGDKLSTAEQQYDYDLPAFDFGDAFVEWGSAYPGEDVITELSCPEFIEAVEGKLRLPYKECLFLHRLPKHGKYHERRDIIHIVQSDNALTARVFCKIPASPSAAKRRWIRAAYHIEFRAHELMLVFVDGLMEHKSYAGIRKVAEDNVANIMTGCGMLRSTAVRQTPIGNGVDHFAEREHAGEAASPGVRVIHFDKVAYRTSAGLRSSGSLKSAHDRRGHWRRLDGGRLVWVRDSRIHGGSATAPQYVVDSSAA